MSCACGRLNGCVPAAAMRRPLARALSSAAARSSRRRLERLLRRRADARSRARPSRPAAPSSGRPAARDPRRPPAAPPPLAPAPGCRRRGSAPPPRSRATRGALAEMLLDQGPYASRARAALAGHSGLPARELASTKTSTSAAKQCEVEPSSSQRTERIAVDRDRRSREPRRREDQRVAAGGSACRSGRRLARADRGDASGEPGSPIAEPGGEAAAAGRHAATGATRLRSRQMPSGARTTSTATRPTRLLALPADHDDVDHVATGSERPAVDPAVEAHAVEPRACPRPACRPTTSHAPASDRTTSSTLPGLLSRKLIIVPRRAAGPLRGEARPV